MKEELMISEKVEKVLKKVKGFSEVKIAEFYTRNNNLISIFVIKSDTHAFWKVSKDNRAVNISLCADFNIEELIKIYS